MNTPIPTFLPGRLSIARGAARDYRALERFHYRPKRPATWAGVWVVRYADGAAPARVVAAAVLSWPTVHCAARDRALGIAHWTPRRKLAFVNRHVRTISRVVVHPQFRSLGLAARLVAAICRQCPTRHLEALAVMGRVHPFFEKGGMRKLEPTDPDAPTYYHLDRAAEGPTGVTMSQREGEAPSEPRFPRRTGDGRARTRKRRAPTGDATASHATALKPSS